MNRSLCRLGIAAALLLPSVLCSQEGGAEAEAKKLAEARESRAAEARLTPQPGTVPPSGGNSWFDSTNQDLGTFFGHGEAVGVFRFKNPHEKAIVWRQLHGSCQCAKAVVRVGDREYQFTTKPAPQIQRVVKTAGQPDRLEPVQQIEVEPMQSGEVEVHLDMNGITGPKAASLDIHTTDETLPQTKLNFRATGAQLFVVSPTDVNLNRMAWSETKEFTVTVSSPLHKDWRIVRMDDVPAFDVTWEKTTIGDQTSWVIRGKYGPVSAQVGGGGVLKFYTDVNGGAHFTVRVVAMVQGPLEVKPGGFLSLGLIRKGTKVTREIVFEPNDGADLQAVETKFEKLSVEQQFVSATSRKDGEKLVVELAIDGSAPNGLVKGELVVVLNHPVVKEQRVVFNGMVR